MVRAALECGINVGLQILKSLIRQCKDKIHGNRLKGDLGQSLLHGRNINACSAKNTLELRLEGLDTNADFGDSCSFQCPQDIRRDIIGMQLHANAFGNNKVFLDGTDDLSQPVCRKGRCAAAKIQAVRFLFTALLTAHSVDLPQQSIYVSVAQILGISDLAVRTEVADAPAKRDMHIQAQIVAVLVRQNIVVFIFEDERLCRTCQPHSGQRCNDTHMAPICISGRLSASQV